MHGNRLRKMARDRHHETQDSEAYHESVNIAFIARLFVYTAQQSHLRSARKSAASKDKSGNRVVKPK